jgi:hypothetical protein
LELEGNTCWNAEGAAQAKGSEAVSLPPKEAKFEAHLGDGCALWDVSNMLPRHPVKSYRSRDTSAIRTILLHKSGADGPAGYRGALGMTRYCISPRPPQGYGRNWPGAPYHVWLPKEPDTDRDDNLVAYRCQPDRVRCYHTGGVMNEVGIGIAVQGYYDGDGDMVADVEPTDAQKRMLGAIVEHFRVKYRVVFDKLGPDDDYGLSGHWEHGKPVCPGDWIRMWAVKLRGDPVTIPAARPSLMEIDTASFGIRGLQTALRLLGYDAGPVDGIRGYQTRGAIEHFQQEHGLRPDGWYGAQTASMLLRALRERNLADRALFERGAGAL